MLKQKRRQPNARVISWSTYISRLGVRVCDKHNGIGNRAAVVDVINLRRQQTLDIGWSVGIVCPPGGDTVSFVDLIIIPEIPTHF